MRKCRLASCDKLTGGSFCCKAHFLEWWEKPHPQCKNCGVIIHRRDRIFCNTECQKSYTRIKERTCICGEKFMPRWNKSPQIYCTYACSVIYRFSEPDPYDPGSYSNV